MKSSVKSVRHLHQSTGSDRKVLYMERNALTEVQLDGPALKVKVESQADRLYPLSRLSRIVLDTGVNITIDAMLACTSRGISICFTDPQAGVVARMIGANSGTMTLPQLLSEFLDRVDWPDRYADWQHAMRVRAFLRILKKLRMSSARSVSPNGLGELFQQWAIKMSDKETAERTDRWLNELSYAWFIQLLSEQGVGNASETGSNARMDLALDLGQIMRWELELYRLDWLRKRHVLSREKGGASNQVSRKETIFWFESIAWQVEEAGSRLLNRLQQWLVELRTE